MTSPNNLDLKGDFQTHPVAELLVEIVQAKLSGSLRMSRAKQKSIVYFRDGAVVYGVSNAREHRLFSVLLTRKRIEEKILAKFPNLANDFELATELEERKLLTKAELDEIVTIQIESIVVDALTWQNGDWIFSPLARSREDLIYKADIHKILMDYARCLPSQDVYRRFRSVQEAFYREPNAALKNVLQPHEQHALEQFNGSPLTLEEFRSSCNLPESAMLQSLYVLWLGGLLVRSEWNAAFSQAKIGEILSTKVSLVKSADKIAKPVKEEEKQSPSKPAVETQAEKLPELEISVEEYLDRVEKAETLYDVLGISVTAPLSDIKNAYFALAKLFHPDRFHREEASKLRRIQVAFTQLAHAYETLRNSEGRENYNFKMRKEIDYREKRRAAGQADATTAEDRQAEQGLGSFEQAMEALNEEEYAAAAGHLSRAVHYSPQNALYHAYFGFALSQLDKQHHKAEASLQTAVKLDPANPKIRMMLVDFFIDMKMVKRAEGELKRFLELAPGNAEAAKKLASLQT